MTRTHRTIAFAAILAGSLTLPKASYAITGCTNANLMGSYNAQISSANLANLLKSIGNTGGTGTGTGTGTTTASTNPGGFGNNPNSISGKIPGLGRYFFDGNGNIDGVASGVPGYLVIGSYTVNDDCSATMSLKTGETFRAVVAANGARVLFIQSDTNGGGAVGELNLTTTACLSGGAPQTFAFNFFGARQPTTTTPAGGTSGGTTSVTTTGPFQATAGLGSLTLDGNGSFKISEWVFNNGTVSPASASGTYTFGMNCNLQLTFNTGSGATTGSVNTTGFQGLLVSSSGGLLVMQADSSSGNIVTGDLVAQ